MYILYPAIAYQASNGCGANVVFVRICPEKIEFWVGFSS